MDFNLSSDELTEHLSSLRRPQPGEKKLLHPYLGNICLYAHQVPHIQALELSMNIPGNRLIISNTNPNSEAINISFQLQGSMLTNFAGIHHTLNMYGGVHNLVYLSSENYGDKHVMQSNQQIDVLQLTIDKSYFIQCVEDNNTWSEKLLNKIEKNTAFSASEQSPAITPRMHYLINCIRTDKQTKPMQGLLLQSRVLELLALQLEQFLHKNLARENSIAKEDMHKLYALKNYIDSNFLCDLNLTQLSRVCCLNEFKIKKGFKQEFSETVFGYVKKLRMTYAASLLHDTTASVDEVADMLGYAHAHHFAKAFKDFTGFSPSVFRGK